MKKLLLIISAVLTGAGFVSCSDDYQDATLKGGSEYVGGGNAGRQYDFSGYISLEVLQNYLSRAILQAEFLASEGFYNDGAYPNPGDDERMILNVGAKFVGRALYSWGFEDHFNDPAWLANARAKIERMHGEDPQIIFQACMFEVVTQKVNTVPVPGWVFTDFGLPAEDRNFDMDRMRFDDRRLEDTWNGNGIVPDITQTETQMFFYFMAVKYMEIGIEALNFGQVQLIGQVDATREWASWRKLLGMLRTKAATTARRGVALCDGHTPNVAVDGELVFDFASFPLRLKEIAGEPTKAEIKKFYNDAIYGLTAGGMHPQGWSCTRTPYLVEFDNFGISTHPGTANLADHFVWGYDEISWLYQQDEDYRNRIQWEITDYLGKVDPAGYLQMSGSRVVTLPGGNTRYRCNTRSEACPEGMSQEETIKEIWGT